MEAPFKDVLHLAEEHGDLLLLNLGLQRARASQYVGLVKLCHQVIKQPVLLGPVLRLWHLNAHHALCLHAHIIVHLTACRRNGQGLLARNFVVLLHQKCSQLRGVLLAKLLLEHVQLVLGLTLLEVRRDQVQLLR